jgi:hypothetical protein
MSCQAIKSDYSHCRNWAKKGGDLCMQHRNLSPTEQKNRWFNRYILAKKKGGIPYHYIFSYRSHFTGNLKDLKSGKIVLTQEEIASIPNESKYVDIYCYLCSQGYAKPSWNPSLRDRSIRYFCKTLIMMIGIPTINSNCIIDAKFITNVLPFLENEREIWGINSLLYKHISSWLIEFLGHETAMLRFFDYFTILDQAMDECWSNMDDLLGLYYNLLKNPKTNTIDNQVYKYFYTHLEGYILPLLKTNRQTLQKKYEMKMKRIKEDLDERSWHPDRVWNWCLDEEHKKYILQKMKQ